MQFYSEQNSLNDMYSPMDRPSNSIENPDIVSSDSPAADLGLGIQDIGMSVPMGIAAPNVQGIYGKIRSGVSKIEIGFPGAVSGNRQAHTPEMYGKDQRQAMRELGLINNVQFTTHAAYQIMGMTGAVEQGSDLYKFDMNRARMGQHEVERAIDFAADVAGGGSVVVHTGEYERPLTDMYLGPDTKNLSEGHDGRIMFKKRLTEDKDAKFYLIDDRTGQAMSTVEKDRLVAYPIWKTADENKEGLDKEGNKIMIRKGDYLDYEGRKVTNPYDPVNGRVPEFDPEKREFQVRYMSFEDFKEEAERKNKWFEKINNRPPNDYEKITQTEAFLQATLETNEGHSRGWSGQYSSGVKDEIKTLESLQKARESYKKLDESLSPEERWKVAVTESGAPATRNQTIQQMVPSETKNPLDVIDNEINDLRARINFSRQASVSQLQQAQDTAETKKHIVDPIKYVDRFAVRHYTEAALHAMERSKDPNNPIVITMENIFPERFGGHPQELKWLIQKSREKMVEYLTEPKIELGMRNEGESAFKRGKEGDLELRKTTNQWYRQNMSKKEAEKIAERHIKATIDTGHMNMWRKYFQPKQGSNPEENEKEFRQWWREQITDLAKDNMIGNMHLTDNFGYQDDHLAPGQGNTPVRETIEILKRFGYDKALTVEPGADASTDVSDFHGLMKTWRYFGSTIYGAGAPSGSRQTWGQVQNSYFGQNQPPYFVFGAYSPSNDWTLWSQVPME
jgi:xylose isomerase-like TIM barrel protein